MTLGELVTKLTQAMADHPEMADAEVTPGKTWYLVLWRDGSIWAETSSRAEAVREADQIGSKPMKMESYMVRTPWEGMDD
jgi:hypothetical protein